MNVLKTTFTYTWTPPRPRLSSTVAQRTASPTTKHQPPALAFPLPDLLCDDERNADRARRGGRRFRLRQDAPGKSAARTLTLRLRANSSRF